VALIRRVPGVGRSDRSLTHINVRSRAVLAAALRPRQLSATTRFEVTWNNY